MPGSRASVFGEAEDFQAALSADGVGEVLFTGRGQFRARMTQVGLERLRLVAVEETQSRVAFITVPRGIVLVSFPTDAGPSSIWGGAEIRAGGDAAGNGRPYGYTARHLYGEALSYRSARPLYNDSRRIWDGLPASTIGADGLLSHSIHDPGQA